MTTTRHYRFAPRDRTGWVLGLNAVQCAALGIGVFEAGLLLESGMPLPLVGLPILFAVVASFARLGGRPFYVQAAAGVRWLLARWLGVAEWEAALPDELPPFLDGFRIVEAPAPMWVARLDDCGIGMVVDEQDMSISATIPVRARRFSLCETDEQDRLLGAWGSAIATFAIEGSVVKRISWGERAAQCPVPTSLAGDEKGSAVTRSYLDLVADQARASVLHETTVTITVDLRKVSGAGGGKEQRVAAGQEALSEELRLLTVRLADCGLDVDAPLSPAELRHAICARLDPDPGEVTTGRTLAQLTGIERSRTGPRAALLEWNWVKVDRSLHHTYVIAEWPRSDVEASWMESLLLHAGGTRTVSLFAEPVPPSQSRKRIRRDATRLATDADQRSQAGFRIGADHHQASIAVAEREAELVAGHVEFTYVGLVTVTARSAESLRASCLEYEQRAAQCGIRLESLDASHDLGLVCSLPLGRGPRSQKTAA